MVDDSLPPADKTIIVFLETVAFVLGWNGVDRLFAKGSVLIGILTLIASASISYTGFQWPKLRTKLSALTRERLMVICAVIAVLMVTAIGYRVYRHYYPPKQEAATEPIPHRPPAPPTGVKAGITDKDYLEHTTGVLFSTPPTAPSKKTLAAQQTQRPIQPPALTPVSPNNGGAAIGSVSQGPCSNLQNGGSFNQQTTNCTFENSLPHVTWDTAEDNVKHSVQLKIKIDKAYPGAMFAVWCDTDCEGVSASIDYGSHRPSSIVHPEVEFGRPSSGESKITDSKLVVFLVDFPAVLTSDMAVIAIVKAEGDAPLKIKDVTTLTITNP